MTHPPALEVQGLTRRYGRYTVVDNLSFVVPHNVVAAFVGANGAGKTTTYSLIAGFLKAHAGKVKIDGVDAALFRREGGLLGILPQDAQYFEHRSVGRQLRLFAELAGFSGREARLEVERVLDLVKLTDRFHDRAETLSHGMRVRLGVAQALIGSPHVVLLDEPTAGLDPLMVEHFRELVASLRGTTTLLISSHDLANLEQICEYVVIIDKGKLVRQGPLREMVGASSVVSYTLEITADQRTRLIAAFPQYSFSESGDELRVRFDITHASVSSVNAAILPWCFAQGVGVIDVGGRARLEDAYLRSVRPN